MCVFVAKEQRLGQAGDPRSLILERVQIVPKDAADTGPAMR
ncbi:hypothetical protein LC55x_0803 [Lysobacter capsici]|jgi:hypothetical protein|nr:hypothetical protein LC55x_0803 [Lysobacter capsici]